MTGVEIFIIFSLLFMNRYLICPLLLVAFLSTYAQQSAETKPRLNHIAVYVVDLNISTAFYKDIVGLDTFPAFLQNHLLMAQKSTGVCSYYVRFLLQRRI